MRKRVLYYSIFIIFGVISNANAQRLYELTPYSFYQEWGLVVSESNKGVLVYRPSKNSKSTLKTLSFSRKNNEWFSEKVNAVEKQTIDRVKAKNNKPGICPTGGVWINRKSNDKIQEFGIWKVYMKDGLKFLVLKHNVYKRGKDFKFGKIEEFEIVSLEDDKMVLRTVNNNAESL